jgi:hypothetical protein
MCLDSVRAISNSQHSSSQFGFRPQAAGRVLHITYYIVLAIAAQIPAEQKTGCPRLATATATATATTHEVRRPPHPTPHTTGVWLATCHVAHSRLRIAHSALKPTAHPAHGVVCHRFGLVPGAPCRLGWFYRLLALVGG